MASGNCQHCNAFKHNELGICFNCGRFPVDVRVKIDDGVIDYPEGYVTKPCDECGSYAFHETSCGKHPVAAL